MFFWGVNQFIWVVIIDNIDLLSILIVDFTIFVLICNMENSFERVSRRVMEFHHNQL